MTYEERIKGYVQDVSCLEISYANQHLSNPLIQSVYESGRKHDYYGDTIPIKEDRKNFVIRYYRDLLNRTRNEAHIANAVYMLNKLSA